MRLWAGFTVGCGVLGALIWAGLPATAHACGGLFCNSQQNQQVNQAAERIVFAHHDDGEVTAIVEIMYEGEADRFAWVLPVPGVPEVAVSSTQALDQLQQLTNPVYTLNTQLEGNCAVFGAQAGAAGTGGGFAAPTSDAADLGNAGPAVVVEAAGTVGPYDYTVISLNPALSDPADVAVEWLDENDYDVGALGPSVLRPYLEDGLNLLAFKLTKGNTTGSIRPVMFSYPANQPSIPIRPTAVAANDHMGVMVWVLGEARAVTTNYRSLELNEALINWFNPTPTYNDVINRAAEEAGGQGFVTEFSGGTEFLADAIFPNWQRQDWNSFQSASYESSESLLREAAQRYLNFDGFDAVLARATDPVLTVEDVQSWLNCFAGCELQTSVDPQELEAALFELVIEPLLDTHDLLLAFPQLTRLYTTMSADDMTLDPIFDQNDDLADVDNQHVATRTIECGDGGDQFTSPWRVDLPQGDVVRGTGSVWPVETNDISLPANRMVRLLSTQGEGEVVRDNRMDIAMSLVDAEISDPADLEDRDFSVPETIRVTERPPRTGGPSDEDDPDESASSGGGGLFCSVGPIGADRGPGGALLLLGLAALSLGRTTRQRQR